MSFEHSFKLRMDCDMANDLEDLSAKLGMNEATVLRRAFALYVEVKRNEKNQVLIRDIDTGETTTLLGV